MYAPADFHVTDKAILLSFLETHAFGMLVIVDEIGFPQITHVPFLLKQAGDKWIVEGHISRMNPSFAATKHQTKASFIVNGAQGYVSSSVYTHVNVPTYNYETVHLVGALSWFEGNELLVHLNETVAQFESPRNHPIDFDLWPKEMIQGYSQEIIGFRIRIDQMDGIFKLSQNRNEIDFQRIVADLEKGSITDQLLAQSMKKLKQ